MPCKIIVSNQCNFPKGYIIAIVGVDHVLSQNESMQEWIKTGNKANEWKRTFSTVITLDKTIEELQYILDPYVIYKTDPPSSDGRKYSFSEPDKNSDFYAQLFNKGEVEVNWSDAEVYLVERT